MNKATESYIRDLDSFFYGNNGWQAGFYQLVKDLDYKQASWKPSGERNSVWKIVKHVIFWKYSIQCNKNNKPLTSEEKQAGDWRDIPENPDENLWQKEILLLKQTHEDFKTLIINTGEELFDINNNDSNYIREVINHDSYHAGQIGLLRVLQGLKPIEY